jgi:hypothetical protein
MRTSGRYDLRGWGSWIDGWKGHLRTRNERPKKNKNKNKQKQTKAKQRKTNNNQKANKINECLDTASCNFRGLPARLLREREG